MFKAQGGKQNINPGTGTETQDLGLGQGPQTFSVKDKTVNILDFVGYKVLVIMTTQLCCCSIKVETVPRPNSKVYVGAPTC